MSVPVASSDQRRPAISGGFRVSETWTSITQFWGIHNLSVLRLEMLALPANDHFFLPENLLLFIT